MNFQTLQQDFFDSGFAYLNDAGNGLARAQRWINQAYLEIAGLENWTWLETDLVTTAPVSILDLSEVITVWDTTNSVPLEQSDYRSLLDSYGEVTTTGLPVYWYQSGSTVSVYPVSTTSLTIRYVKTPAELSTSGSTPVVPAEFHDVIVLGAVRRGLLDDQDAGDYQLVRSEWDQRIQMMREKYLPRYGSQLIVSGAEDW
jgi:hypothetical protein